MLYQRGKQKTWWYRFRFGGRIVHESAKSTSKTIAREAERQRRRELETSWNHVGGRRELPPTFEQASKEYQQSRLGRVSAHTADIDKYALKHLLPVFGAKLLCDITAEDIACYQKKRQQVFPWSNEGRVDPTRPTNGWRTAWEKARKRAGVEVRFHDLRVTCITKLAEGQASDQTIKAIAGHVSQRMLEHYSRIRMDAKRRALDAIVQPLEPGLFGTGVHQNGNQVEAGEVAVPAKSLN